MTIHIGLIAPEPPPYGGMANQARQLYQLLQQEPDLKVSFLPTNAPYRNRYIASVKGLRALFRLFYYAYRVFKLAGKVDVIHVFSNSGWSWQLFSAPVLWISAICKTPVIINYRGGEAQTYFSQSIRWITPSMKKATAIIVPSGFLQHVFKQFGFTVQIIPNIIDLQRFQTKQPKKLTKDNLHLVITRNLEAIYGIKTAIHALALLKQQYPQIKLSIAGSGEQENELKQLVLDLKLEENITFTGKLTPEQVCDLYSYADVMLNPTTVDNMPNSVLEAMASGVAIITTNVGGIPYIVEDNETALFVKPNCPEMMANRVVELLQNEDLYTRLITQARKSIEQYAWASVRTQWLSLYQTLAQE